MPSRIKRMGILALVAFWFFVPLPEPEPVKIIEADRGNKESSATETFPLSFTKDSEEITYRLSVNVKQGGLYIQLLDSGKYSRYHTFIRAR